MDDFKKKSSYLSHEIDPTRVGRGWKKNFKNFSLKIDF